MCSRLKSNLFVAEACNRSVNAPWPFEAAALSLWFSPPDLPRPWLPKAHPNNYSAEGFDVGVICLSALLGPPILSLWLKTVKTSFLVDAFGDRDDGDLRHRIFVFGHQPAEIH